MSQSPAFLARHGRRPLVLWPRNALSTGFPVITKWVVETCPRLRQPWAAVGVTVLQDQVAAWRGSGEWVAIIGMADCTPGRADPSYARAMKSLVAAAGDASLKILLSHRPHLVRLYGQSGADLVFSGHAHGGQINLPGTRPLVLSRTKGCGRATLRACTGWMRSGDDGSRHHARHQPRARRALVRAAHRQSPGNRACGASVDYPMGCTVTSLAVEVLST